MDDRIRRLGEHAAATQPLWARQALGPVPGDPVARAGLGAAGQRRGRLPGTLRLRPPGDPIGPEPAKTSPEARAAWHAALDALGRVDGIDLRGCTDGDLWLRRGTYERETAWAPPHVAEELRLMRIAERDAHVNAVRAEHERRAAHDEQTAARHQQLARIWRALEAKAATEAEHVRRRPGNPAPMGRPSPRPPAGSPSPPTSNCAAATPACRSRRCARTPPKPTASPTRGQARPAEVPPGYSSPSTDQRPVTDTGHRPARNERTAGNQREADGQLALGLTPEAAHDEIPEQVLRIRENASDRPGQTRRPGAHPAARRRAKTTRHPGSPGRPARAATATPCSSRRARRRPLRPHPRASPRRHSRMPATPKRNEADE